MGIKNVFKWRVTSTKYLYLIDEENIAPFILNKKTGNRYYPVPLSGGTVEDITEVTGMTLDEGLISQTVAQIKSATDYSVKYDRMVELAYKDDDASGLTFLDYTKYFNLDGDECIEEAVTPKCEGYEPVFNVSAYTLQNSGETEVEYTFYAERNEADKTLRYNLELGIPRGEKGEKGDDGVGCKGEPGEPGLPAIIDNVSATIRALDPDEQPDVKVVSSSTQDNKYDLQFNFKIPRGEQGVPGDEGQQGEDGIPARLAYVGIESETLLPSEDAYVQIKDGSYEIEKVYDSEEGQEFYDTSFILQFGLPQGLQGIQGEPGRNAEIRNVTVSRVETIEPGYWYPNEEDPNREWIWNNAQAGVEITPIGGGNIVDLAFWFIIPRGAKGDKGDDGSGGGGSIYNFENPVKDLSGNPVGSFTVTEMIDGTHNVELTLWGSGGGETDIKHRYNPNVDSLSEGVLPIEVDNKVLPYAVASGVRSHAEGIGITPEPPALENIIGGLKNNCHGNNIIVMPKQQFVDADVDWSDLDEGFFIGATFSIPSGITINANALPSGVTETQFRNSILTIKSCSLDSYDTENNYFSLEDVSVSFDVAGQTYQINSTTFEQTVGGESGTRINEYVDWNNPITIHINDVSPISIPNAIGVASHTEGNGCQTNGDYSHAEGNGTHTVGVASHAEGAYTEANGNYSHASGFGTVAEGTASYAGGYAEDGSTIEANSTGSHAEGYAFSGGTIEVNNLAAHAEGYVNGGTIEARGAGSHAEGCCAESNGTIEATEAGSHAEGCVNGGQIISSGYGSHAEGYSHSDKYVIYARQLTSEEKQTYNISDDYNCIALNCGIPEIEPNGYLIYDDSEYTSFKTFIYNSEVIHNYTGVTDDAGHGDGSISNVNVFGVPGEDLGGFTEGTYYLTRGILSKNNGSHAEGISTIAYSNGAHSEGKNTIASGSFSHAEGQNTTATYAGSHAEGDTSYSSGLGSHAEGVENRAIARGTHAEGENTLAEGWAAHSEGHAASNGIIKASGDGSHAGGYAEDGTIQANDGSGAYARGFANDNGTIEASGDGSHAEGYAYGSSTIEASDIGAHAEGYASGSGTIHADSNGSHAIGCAIENGTIQAISEGSHAEGYAYSGGTIEANDSGAHAEGYASGSGTIQATSMGAHAEGYVENGGIIQASGNGSHAEGCNTIALNDYSHAEGYGYEIMTTSGSCVLNTNCMYDNDGNEGHSHIVLAVDSPNVTNINNATFTYSSTTYVVVSADYRYDPEHAHSIFNNVKVRPSSGSTSGETELDTLIGQKHTEDVTLDNISIYGSGNAVGIASHTEGGLTLAYDSYAHAEGWETEALGVASHAEGGKTTACGDYSHSGGYGTMADNDCMTAVGKYNSYRDSDILFVVGYGTNNENRRNAFMVYNNGNCYADGAFYNSSDARKKDVVGDIPLEKAYELIEKCQTIYYTWKNDEEKVKQVGLLAQEVKEYFPELVSKTGDGYLSLDYSRLTVILMAIIKDLTSKVKKLETLEERIKQLEEKNK